MLFRSTNEQMNREKSNAGWEYSFWVIVIVGVVVVLLILIVWFMFKKDENVELQRQVYPYPGGHPGGHPGHNPHYRPAPKPDPHAGQDKKDSVQTGAQPSDKKDEHEDMDDQARANLMKKKSGKRNIGPVPGEIPDNPGVVGIIPQPAHAVSEQVVS